MLARVTDIRKSKERLKGIMLGIAIDGRVNTAELEALSAWLTDHPGLTVKEPFRCIADTIHNILEDGIIGK